MELKLLGAIGALGEEATELNHCLLRLGCALEDMQIVVSDITNWLSNA